MTMPLTSSPERVIKEAQQRRKEAGYDPLDVSCQKCGTHEANGYKIVDEDHQDQKQRCFLCGFTRYIDGADS